MKHLGRNDLVLLRERLLAREAQLAGEIALGQARIEERGADFGDREGGQIDYDAALALADLARDQQEIDQVRSALGRMDRGTYGRCLSCGVAVPPERLHAEPGAELCHVCQTRAEGA